MKIEVITLDKDESQTDAQSFDTMKEARQWIKECGLNAAYWNRKGETSDFAKSYVNTLQLYKDGECVQDYFPSWYQRTASSYEDERHEDRLEFAKN